MVVAVVVERPHSVGDIVELVLSQSHVVVSLRDVQNLLSLSFALVAGAVRMSTPGSPAHTVPAEAVVIRAVGNLQSNTMFVMHPLDDASDGLDLSIGEWLCVVALGFDGKPVGIAIHLTPRSVLSVDVLLDRAVLVDLEVAGHVMVTGNPVIEIAV